MTRVETKKVGAGEDGMRLDRWFKTHYAGLPHSRLEKLLRTGQVRVDGGRAKASTRLAEGQTIRVPPLPDVAPPPGPKHALSKADRDFLADITLYEDDDLLVLNKPSGIAVQGGTKTPHHIDRLLEGMGDGPETRPRLVHRLDRDTVGRAGGRQAPGGRGQARPRVPDPLGAEDLLGAGARRAEAAARQDRGGSGQGVGARRRPRAQGAARRAGSGAIGGDPLCGGGPGRAGGRRSSRSSRSPGGSTSCAPIWPFSATPSSGTRNIRAAPSCRRVSRTAPPSCAAHQLPPSLGGGVVDVTAPLPPHMAAAFAAFGFEAKGGNS